MKSRKEINQKIFNQEYMQIFIPISEIEKETRITKRLEQHFKKRWKWGGNTMKDIHWRDAKKEKPPTDIEILGKCKGNCGNEYVSVIKVSSDRPTYNISAEYIYNVSIDNLIKWAYLND